MVFGLAVQPWWMLVGGISLFLLIGFQVLVGLRKIKLGRKTFVYHKWIAYSILAIAAIHGLLGVLFVTGFNLF